MKEQQVGPYRLLEEIGRGGLGVVFRARGPDGGQVALKLLLVGGSASDTQRRRFGQEVHALTRLRHPTVVRVLDAGEHRRVPWLATEWIDGESLEARLTRAGPLDPREAARLVARLARAIEACHAQGVLHRDLKPGNVLLRAGSGEPVLIDFGLAGELQRDTGRSALTVTGQLMGSPAWWPPEQAHGDRGAIGPRSDVYGLGALLYGALSGAPLHRGESMQEVLLALERGPAPLRELAPGVPARLEAICARALRPLPAERHPSAAALAAELEQWAAAAAAPPARWRLGSALAPVVLVGLGLVGSLLIATAAPTPPAPSPTPAPPPPPPPPSPPSPPLAPVSPPDASHALEEVDPREVGARDPRVREASAAFNAGDATGALELLDRLLVAEPDHVGGLRLRAWVRAKRGDHAGAVVDAERALATVPADVDLRGNLAAWLGRVGQVGRARQELERALAMRPDHPDNLALRAWLRVSPDTRGGASDPGGGRPDHQGALADLERALALAPDHPEALMLRAESRQFLGDARGALADADRAVALQAGDARARRRRAPIRVELGDLSGALQDMDAWLAENPQDPGGWSGHGYLRRRMNDLAGAIEDYDRALALQPDYPAALSNRATAKRLLGDLPGARADLDRAIGLGGDQAAHFQRALVRRELGELGGSLEDATACLAINPRHLEARLLRAELLLEGGDRAGALTEVEQVLADPTASTDGAAPVFERARQLREQARAAGR